MKRIYPVYRIVLVWLALVLATAPVNSQEPEANPDIQFLDQLLANGIPAGYGEILGALSDGATDALRAGVQQGSPNLATLANQKVWRDKISAVNQAIGRLSAVLDVGGKIYSEQYDEAAISAAIALLSEYAASEGGKQLLASYGMTGPVVASALVSFTVWRESAKALSEATMGRELESLYGTIELMTRERGRTLGQGDPFPVNQQNIEKVWKRILSDPSFRHLFQVYVTNELQKPFPEPSFWDKIDAYLSDPTVAAALDTMSRDPVGPYSVTLTEEAAKKQGPSAEQLIEQRQKELLLQQYAEIKPYIAGLIGVLNRAAKVQEQQVLARQAFAEFKAKVESGGMSVDQYFAKIQHAIDFTGVVEAYLARCMPEIEKAAKEEDYETLRAHLQMSSDYVRDVVAWLPAEGPTAAVRQQLYQRLQASYKAAADGIREMKKKLAAQIEKPKPAPLPSGQPAPETPIDPLQYYTEFFKPLIKPFEWGDGDEPARAVALMEDAIKEGRFLPPEKTYGLPAGKTPDADIILDAWQKQHWGIAFGRIKHTTLPVPAAPAEKTIGEYSKKLLEDVNKRFSAPPAELTAIRETLKVHGEAISERFREGEALVFPSKYGKQPPEGETMEEAKARRDRGNAIIEESRRMSEALQPTRKREADMAAAWAEAKRMAEQAVNAQKTTVQIAHAEFANKMAGDLSVARQEAVGVAAKYNEINGRLKALPLPYASYSKPDEIAPQISALKAEVDRDPYTKLGTVSKPPDSTISTGLSDSLNRRADEMMNRSRALRTSAARAEAQTLAQADAYRKAADEYDLLLAQCSEYLGDIRTLINPDFLQGDDWSKRRQAAEKASKELPAAIAPVVSAALQDAENRESDAFWLKRAAANFSRFVRTGQSYGVIEEYGSYGNGGMLRPVGDPMSEPVIRRPYLHYLTDKERQEAVREMKAVWDATNLGKFADSLAPWLKEAVDGFFNDLAAVKVLNEDNFLVATDPASHYAMAVTSGSLAACENILKNMQPGTAKFDEQFGAIASSIPLAYAFSGPNAGKFQDVIVPAETPLGARYLAIRNKLKEMYPKHLELKVIAAAENQRKAGQDARAQLPGFLSTMRSRMQEGKRMIDAALALPATNKDALKKAYDELEAFHSNTLLSEPYSKMINAQAALAAIGAGEDQLSKDAQDMSYQVGNMSGSLHEAKAKLKQLMDAQAVDRSAEFKEFYDKFKQAYETRNDSRLMGLIADSWSSGDGTTVDDLREHFHNMFSVFNEIRVTITNLKGESIGDGLYRVSYDITIKGRIFANRIEHEEKSSVTEELQVNSRGTKIVKTLEGKFWYVR